MSMPAAFLVLALIGLASEPGPVDAQTSSAAPDAPRTAEERARLAAAWRESLELDLPAEVLTQCAWVEARADADPELAALCARALHAAGLDQRAAAILARARGAPPAAAAHYALAGARIALELDDVARARAALAPEPGSNALTRYPTEAESYLLLGRALARAGDLARAEPLLLEFVQRAPLHVEAPQAWFVLVDCARARGDAPEAARRDAARARSVEWHAFYRARRIQVRASPREPLPRYGLAQLWLAANELERAQQALDEVLALDPRFCRGLELLAEVERRAGRADAATRRCDEALACDAALVEVHLTRARIARDAGDSAASATHLARYRELGGAKPL